MFFRGLNILFWVLVSPLYASDSTLEPVLAKVYRQNLDLRQWWVSEKLDGVRAIWDGKQLYFRSGRPIQSPKWFTQQFPKAWMDGELWMGRGTFEKTSAAVRRNNPQDEEWQMIRYQLFELPGASGSFTRRVEQMQRIAEQVDVPWLQPVLQQRMPTTGSLFVWLDQVVAEGGEGLMLHRAESLYHGGRSSDLLKLKSWQDAEARGIAILSGKGKYSEMMGSLLVEDMNGYQFRIGSGFSDLLRRSPPAVGSVITYKFTGTTDKGLPRFASFLRLREHDNTPLTVYPTNP